MNDGHPKDATAFTNPITPASQPHLDATDPYSSPSPVEHTKSATLAGRISRIVWDRDEKSEEERKFVQRLDIGLMTTIMLQYYVKYLSQANVNNAYVSGMKEDLNFTGDEYNLLLTCFTIGYVIGQFPATLLMVKISPSIWLPCCEIFWTVLVMICARAKNPQTLMGLRFLIGMAEASSYPGGIWLLGSWYNKNELGKRAVLFICSSSVGTMFSGWLQAGVLNLSGRGGLQGWQWLFIIDGCIALPIAFSAFFILPDTPDRPNPRARWWLRERDIKLGRERMVRINRVPQSGWSLKTFKQAFSNWVPWAFVIPYTCFVVGLGSYAYMNLWLKSTGKYTTSKVNLIPTGGYGLQVFTALIYAWTSDALGLRWPVIMFGGTVALVGNIILATWPASDNLKFAGFFLNFTVVGCGALTLSWANELVSKTGAEHRAIVIGFLNTASYVFNAWVPNLIFPASKAPAYRGVGGYKVTAAFFAALVIGAGLIRILEIREDSRVKERQPEQALDLAVADENRKTSEEADLEEKRY